MPNGSCSGNRQRGRAFWGNLSGGDIYWMTSSINPVTLDASASLSLALWSGSCIMQMVRGQAKGYRKTYRQSFRIILSVQITFICTFWFPSCSLFQCNNFQPRGRPLTHTHTRIQAAQEAVNGCGAQEAQLPGPPPSPPTTQINTMCTRRLCNRSEN